MIKKNRIWISTKDYDSLKNGNLILEAKGEPPVLVAPVDSVWFAENVCGVKLLEYQKKLVRSMDEMKNPQIMYGRNGNIRIVDAKQEEK